MAGAGFSVIKKRIKSINNTKKITKAMGLVATSKLRKNKEKLYLNNQYRETLESVVKGILENYEDENVFISGNNSKKKIYIIITSSLGLCGGYNGNVISELTNAIKGNKENSFIICLGQKGRNILKRIKLESYSEYLDLPSLPTLKSIKPIAYESLDLYLNGEVGEVNIIYTKFLSTIRRKVVVDKLLPLSMEKENNFINDFEDEDQDKNILSEIIPSYIQEAILNAFLNARASEESTRMEAMEGATKNANDLLDKLNLQYNRLRQSVITQEISEIVGGAEAQR